MGDEFHFVKVIQLQSLPMLLNLLKFSFPTHKWHERERMVSGEWRVEREKKREKR
jgi:hypothetical protein